MPTISGMTTNLERQQMRNDNKCGGLRANFCHLAAQRRDLHSRHDRCRFLRCATE
jgi:hypothetical protein